jgi:hypothetical protein
MEESLEQVVSAIIDKWVNELIGKLLSAGSSAPQRGLWDRFKGGLHNLFLGRTGDLAKKYNPYYLKNKYGDDLGATESYRLTLSDYADVRSTIGRAESKIQESMILSESDSSKLRFVVLIRKAAEELKEKLVPVLSRYSGSAEALATGSREVDAADAAGKDDDEDVPSGATKIKPVVDITPASAASSSSSSKPADPGASSSSSSKPKPPVIHSFIGVMNDTIMFRKSGAILKPSQDWLSDGKLVSEQLPAAICWASNSFGSEISDDEKVERELKSTLPDFSGFEKKHSGGNSLIKSFLEKGSELKIGSPILKKKLIELGVSQEVLDMLNQEVVDKKKKAADEAAASSSGSEARKTLEDIYDGKNTKEEILKSIDDNLISKIAEQLSGTGKRTLKRLWKEYVGNASENIGDLRASIKRDLVSTISGWKLKGVNEDSINQIISGR